MFSVHRTTLNCLFRVSQFYNFTRFAMALNEMDDELRRKICPTDSRLVALSPRGLQCRRFDGRNQPCDHVLIPSISLFPDFGRTYENWSRVTWTEPQPKRTASKRSRGNRGKLARLVVLQRKRRSGNRGKQYARPVNQYLFNVLNK